MPDFTEIYLYATDVMLLYFIQYKISDFWTGKYSLEILLKFDLNLGNYY